jgi:hypothetical protein
MRAPSPRLAGMVERLWRVEDTAAAAQAETICPDDQPEIDIHLGRSDAASTRQGMANCIRWSQGELMRMLLTLSLFAAVAVPATAQKGVTTEDLTFLTGCWVFEAKGRRVEEHWLAPRGGSLMGVSRTVAGGKTTEYEFIQIRDLPEGLAYIAKPSNQAETKFVLASKTADEVVFENPTHDFPQRIRYRHTGDSLHARIEGTINGKSRAIEFPYVKTSCTP